MDTFPETQHTSSLQAPTSTASPQTTQPTSPSGPSFALIFAMIVGMIALGSGSYYLGFHQGRQTTDQYIATTDASPTPTTNTQPTATPMMDEVPAEWKTYLSTYENATFRYPSDWKLQTQAVIDPEVTGALLISPEGLEVSFIPTIDGLGGGCAPEECPLVKTLEVTRLPFKQTNNPTDLYLIRRSYDGKKNMGIISTFKNGGLPVVGEARSFPTYLIFANHLGGQAMFTIIAEQQKYQELTDEEFFALPEVQVARKILTSLHYN